MNKSKNMNCYTNMCSKAFIIDKLIHIIKECIRTHLSISLILTTHLIPLILLFH